MKEQKKKTYKEAKKDLSIYALDLWLRINKGETIAQRREQLKRDFLKLQQLEKAVIEIKEKGYHKIKLNADLSQFQQTVDDMYSKFLGGFKGL